ncbi:hypothetical protein EHF33_20180 (plasmid) [Deinococcus psychrotolerans]|uniref:Uncharacterized protein n=1 Tax=Deinococcus psychrotolerans TaxID=2489213 RepID=A0A3G8YKM8_9DEIO|nr:hypothetical protein [Deinococcus psychrotolerans]AZI45230.1 hypothetical protein EHF33_20180 [Deinococcus psychrotolerans]
MDDKVQPEQVGDPPSEGVARTLITQTMLRDRGWNEKMARELLGKPDEQPPPAYHLQCAPLRLYLLERVEAAERTADFAQMQARRQRQQTAGGQIMPELTVPPPSQVMQEVEALIIEIQHLTLPELIRRACEHHSVWAKAQKRPIKPVRVDSPANDLNRVSVHYLFSSQQTPEYQDLHARLVQLPETREARQRLKERVYQAIAQRYPHLALECEQQNGRSLTLQAPSNRKAVSNRSS